MKPRFACFWTEDMEFGSLGLVVKVTKMGNTSAIIYNDSDGRPLCATGRGKD